MNDLIEHLTKIRNAMMDLNIFSDIQFNVEPAQYLPNFTEIVAIVKENKYNKTMFNTSVGTNGQNIGVQYVGDNFFGGVEKVTISSTMSNKEYNLSGSIEKPLLRNTIGPHPIYGASFLIDTYDYKSISDYYEKIFGIQFYFNHLKNNLSLNFDTRFIEPTPSSSDKLLYQSGWNSKISLRHSYILDKRDNTHLPTSGYAIKIINELAIPPGSQKFLKHEISSQYNISLEKILWEGVALNFVLKGGVFSWIGNKTGVSVSDKFYLGGDNFNGFRDRGVNNQIKGEENLGGDSYFQTSVILGLPFPKSYDFPSWIRPEIFLQTGNIINSQKQSYSSLFLSKNLRSSVGAGFAVSTAWGRISFSTSLPLSYKKSDSFSNFFQFNFQLNWI
eukprot:TRINITY_DN11026_c0_g1_i1.p1 TRINITY_DN11026_c0_g1~~TRINITY_DN11026_c0_g1_i1.p1  ORF type:complete len:429 (-),score=105.89 TRINITY_DN11026_c0_g1_i1:26-1189(-)